MAKAEGSRQIAECTVTEPQSRDAAKFRPVAEEAQIACAEGAVGTFWLSSSETKRAHVRVSARGRGVV
jgi:hypothetical protein